MSSGSGQKLRPYQQRALEAVRDSFRHGHRRTLVVMPTGTGKTVLFAEMARLARGGVLVLAHRQELVEQARDKLRAWCRDHIAVEMGLQRQSTQPSGGTRARITVASVQSVHRRLAKFSADAFSLIVVDEAHHSTAATYRRILDHFGCFVVGVTATPDRSDRSSLATIYSDVAFEYELRAAIDDGWLCPIRSYLVRTQADFSAVAKVAGELATGDVERILGQAPHLAEIAVPVVRERRGRPAIVFAVSVAHAHALARVLCATAGDPLFAAALDGTSDAAERRAIVDRFKRGEIAVLVNCALFTEGFDVPQISLVAIARPVLSRAFYAQMVGRGTRIANGKRDLVVLDFSPANCRHSLVSAVDLFAPDEAVGEAARRITADATEEGRALAIEEALELARQECEARATDVRYQLVHRDPFAAVGFQRPAAVRGDGRASPDQIRTLQRAGLPKAALADLTRRQAYELHEHLLDRRAVGLCSPRQAAQLATYGIDARDLYREHAAELLAHIRRQKKHRSPAELQRDCAAMGAPLVGE